jgi:hypothetical protein
MGRRESELVEVVLDGLDLAVVQHLVAEAEERVLDHPARERRRVERAEVEVVAGERHVDLLLAQRPLQLRPPELVLLRRHRLLDALAERVQRHAALAVPDDAQRLLQLGLAAQEADARLVQFVERRRARDRALRLGFERLDVHGGDCSIGFHRILPGVAGRGLERPGRTQGRTTVRRAPLPRSRAGAG